MTAVWRSSVLRCAGAGVPGWCWRCCRPVRWPGPRRAAGARRTDAAYPGLVAWSRPPDALIERGPGAGSGFGSVPAATVERLPQVTAGAELVAFSAQEPATIIVIAPVDSSIPGSFWHRKLLAGRLPAPDQPGQVDISFTVAQSQHLQVGGRCAWCWLAPPASQSRSGSAWPGSTRRPASSRHSTGSATITSGRRRRSVGSTPAS